MPYFVQTVVLPPNPTVPPGAASPQLQQFAAQLTADLNQFEQRGFHLDQVIEIGPAALLVFKQ